MKKGERVEMDEDALHEEIEGKADDKCVKKGIEIESKEHKSLDEKTIKTLVMDHLKMDKEYYEKED